MTNLVGMALSGSCERVDEIRITESVDCSTYESAETQTAMGFSQDPDTPGLAENVRRESEVFAESAAMMADAIGAKLDRMTFDVTFTAATGDSDLGFMKIPAGTVGGVFGYHRGWVGDRNVVSVGFNWTMGGHVTPPKPLEHGHVIQVFGVPNMRTVVHCLPPKDWTEPGFMGLGMIYTAMPVTNAVPAVVAARPGIVTLADLPPVTGAPRLTMRDPAHHRALAERARALSSSIVSRAKVLIGIGCETGWASSFGKAVPDASVLDRGMDPQRDAFVDNIADGRREETE